MSRKIAMLLFLLLLAASIHQIGGSATSRARNGEEKVLGELCHQCPCDLETKTIDCTGRYFPWIPNGITENVEILVMDNNPVNFSLFKPIGLGKLKRLSLGYIPDASKPDTTNYTLGNNNMANFDLSKYFKELRELAIKRGNFPIIEPWFLSGFNDKLEYLNLPYCRIKTIMPYALDHFRALTNLNLEGNQLVTLPPWYFRMPKLVKLILTSNEMVTISPGAFNGCTNLVSLDLSYNNLTINNPAGINGTTTTNSTVGIHKGAFNIDNGELAILDLSYNAITAIEPGWTHGLINLTDLLSSNPIRDIGYGDWKSTPALRYIDLSTTPLIRYPITAELTNLKFINFNGAAFRLIEELRDNPDDSWYMKLFFSEYSGALMFITILGLFHLIIIPPMAVYALWNSVLIGYEMIRLALEKSIEFGAHYHIGPRRQEDVNDDDERRSNHSNDTMVENRGVQGEERIQMQPLQQQEQEQQQPVNFVPGAIHGAGRNGTLGERTLRDVFNAISGAGY